jgi:hypothetical protein
MFDSQNEALKNLPSSSSYPSKFNLTNTHLLIILSGVFIILTYRYCQKQQRKEAKRRRRRQRRMEAMTMTLDAIPHQQTQEPEMENSTRPEDAVWKPYLVS